MSCNYVWNVLCFVLSLLQNAEVSVFEVNIRFVGGLLSAYYLSGKEVRNTLKHPVVVLSLHLCREYDFAAWRLIDETDGTKQMKQWRLREWMSALYMLQTFSKMKIKAQTDTHFPTTNNFFLRGLLENGQKLVCFCVVVVCCLCLCTS